MFGKTFAAIALASLASAEQDWDKECDKWKKEAKKEGVECSDDWTTCWYTDPALEEMLPGWAQMFAEGGTLYEISPCSKSWQEMMDGFDDMIIDWEDFDSWEISLKKHRQAKHLRLKNLLAKRGQWEDDPLADFNASIAAMEAAMEESMEYYNRGCW